jgi:hypothetical protein
MTCAGHLARAGLKILVLFQAGGAKKPREPSGGTC